MPGPDVMALIRSELPHWPNEAAQKVLYNVLNGRLSEFKPPRALWSYLMKEISRDAGDNLVDELAELVISAVHCIGEEATNELENDFGYVTYDLTGVSDQSRWPVSCAILRNHRQVGCRLWPAGVYMGEILVRMAQSGEFTGKTVVELGSGVGQSALLLASCISSPDKIFLSDSPPEVIDNLRRNIAISEREYDSAASTSLESFRLRCELEAITLDWATVTSEQVQKLKADWVVAADCLYTEELIPGFIRAIDLFLRVSPACKVLVSCTMRDERTFEMFQTIMYDHHFLGYSDISEYARSELLPHPHFHASKDQSVFLLRIFPKGKGF